MFTVPEITGEQVLDVRSGQGFVAQATDPMVTQTTDPLIAPQPYASPGDFAAQYPQPLDPTEIIAMCEELTVWQLLTDETTALKAETWRELNSLAFTSGSQWVSFADGECPEEYEHDGTNTTITLKNLGAKKSLSLSDIIHSTAVAAAGWHGINMLVGGLPSSAGLPGGAGLATFLQETVAGVKEKEVRLGMTLTMNGWDRLLVEGDATTNPLEFDGIELQVTSANGSHTSSSSAASGSISAISYDRFLAESCAKPTHIFGHPQAIQELLSSYFQLGFAGSQVVNFTSGNRIEPGYNFSSFVNTGVGRLQVVSDNNFNRTASGAASFQSALFGLRMVHNGVPLVYKTTQIPLAMKDLAPGCTAISFLVWTKTALIVKHRCAHSRYTCLFNGRVVTTCPVIG